MARIDKSGSGEILKAGEHVCNVSYSLFQTGSLKGWSHMTGTVRVDDAERTAPNVLKTLGSGAMLDLRLENGNRFHVWFSAMDAVGGFWTVRFGADTGPLE